MDRRDDVDLEKLGQTIRDFALDMMQDPTHKLILLRDLSRTIRHFEYRTCVVVLE